jgi:hypothetical protein
MKYIVFIFTISTLFSGCSPKTETGATTNGANPPAAAANSNPANTSLAATNSNPPGMQAYNGIQNVNPNAFNTSNDNLKVIKYQPKKDELPYGSRTAPDDSIITSNSRGTDFLETRTFRSNPVLDKVEKIMDGKTTKYKVYLKSGKVVAGPADKLANMESIAPENILEAIGMAPKPQTSAPVKTDEKKEQKQ